MWKVCTNSGVGPRPARAQAEQAQPVAARSAREVLADRAAGGVTEQVRAVEAERIHQAQGRRRVRRRWRRSGRGRSGRRRGGRAGSRGSAARTQPPGWSQNRPLPPRPATSSSGSPLAMLLDVELGVTDRDPPAIGSVLHTCSMRRQAPNRVVSRRPRAANALCPLPCRTVAVFRLDSMDHGPAGWLNRIPGTEDRHGAQSVRTR